MKTGKPPPPRKHPFSGKPAIELLEEAFSLVRRGGPALLLGYYVGAVPFVIALLFFWAEMSAGAYAEAHLPGAALGMAVAFIWMKCWQSLFATDLLKLIGADEPFRWSTRRVTRLVMEQAVVQGTGLFLLPLAALVTLPFGWCYAFYQSFTLNGSGESVSLREKLGRSMAEAALWPKQNHLGLGYLFLFAGTVFINVISLIFLAPTLLKMLFGMETIFSRNAFTLINTTVFMIALGLTYLLVDPIFKAFYALRCFYGRSRQSGCDLKVSLRRLKAATPALSTALLLLLSTGAQGTDAEQMDRSIDKVLTRPEYAWRAPRVAVKEEAHAGPTILNRFFKAVGNALKAVWKPIKKALKWIFEWASKGWKQNQSPSPGTLEGWSSSIPILVFGLCTIIVLGSGLIAWQAWKRKRPEVALVEATPVQAIPDLRLENVTADQLPEDQWRELARELIAKGEFRLGMRAMYLASLAHLGTQKWITFGRAKSNKEFRTELARRARVHPELIALFNESVGHFERAWYGEHPVSQETVSRHATNLNRICNY